MLSNLLTDFLKNKKSLAIGFCFITIGLLFGSWATCIPFVKNTFQLNDKDLGLLLLTMPMGALVINPLAAFLVSKFGMQKATIIGFCFLILAFGSLFMNSSLYTLPLSMFCCGAGISLTNVAMNTTVGALEKEASIRIMSTCHGIFSIGLMLGSMLAPFVRNHGASPLSYMLGLVIVLSLIMIWAAPHILSISFLEEKINKQASKKIILPSGVLLWMILISICVNVTEGTMADWAAVFMHDVVHADSQWIGIGLTAYSLFMALGRIMGDSIIPKFGQNNVLIWGGVLCVLGLCITVFLPFIPTAILGFAMVGAGVSCGAPIL
ncbi:MAG: MFS transporter, partial [Leadbetterella sp.]